LISLSTGVSVVACGGVGRVGASPVHGAEIVRAEVVVVAVDGQGVVCGARPGDADLPLGAGVSVVTVAVVLALAHGAGLGRAIAQGGLTRVQRVEDLGAVRVGLTGDVRVSPASDDVSLRVSAFSIGEHVLRGAGLGVVVGAAPGEQEADGHKREETKGTKSLHHDTCGARFCIFAKSESSSSELRFKRYRSHPRQIKRKPHHPGSIRASFSCTGGVERWEMPGALAV
jgi:hypothetical protein